jgi:hypothetical protein
VQIEVRLRYVRMGGDRGLANRFSLRSRFLGIVPWTLLAAGVGLLLVGYGLLPLTTVPPTDDYPIQTVQGVRDDPRFVWAVNIVLVGWWLLLAGVAFRARTRLVWGFAVGSAVVLALFGTAAGLGRLMIAATVAMAVVAFGWRRRWAAIGLAVAWILSWLIGTSEGAEGVADAPLGGWLVFARTLYPIALLTLVAFGVASLIEHLRPGILSGVRPPPRSGTSPAP